MPGLAESTFALQDKDNMETAEGGLEEKLVEERVVAAKPKEHAQLAAGIVVDLEGGASLVLTGSQPGVKLMRHKRGEKVVWAFLSEADPQHPLAEMGRKLQVSPLCRPGELTLTLLPRLSPRGRVRR